jgi:GxxExxY protein
MAQMRYRSDKINKKDLLYPELSFKLMGILFDVSNNLGYGYDEKHYQQAIAKELEKNKLLFKRELAISIIYRGEEITKNFLDFLIEDKIVLEIKQGNMFNKKDINQIYKYLVATKKKLGILARFTQNGVKYKRIVNINS